MKNNEEKWALVTGASKGLGFCYAQELLNMGYNIIGVARSSGYANKFKVSDGLKTITYNMDLSDTKNASKLFERIKNIDIDVFINNAGFGVYGNFLETNLDTEMNLINLNIKTLHILTKLMLQKMTSEDTGPKRIINLASVAAYQPGPLSSTYFASKSYVLSLSRAINFEMKKEKRNTRVICISPGPIKTNFNNRAKGLNDGNVDDHIHPKTIRYAKKSLHQALKTKHKDEVVPRFQDKIVTRVIPKIGSKKIIMNAVYKSTQKMNNKD